MNPLKQNLHTHTTYCDGADAPEAVVQEAAGRGFDAIGFSGHAFTPFDTSYCMSREGVRTYRLEIAALKEKYAGRIRVLCGIEQDYYAEPITDPWDYVIGSVHYIFKDDVYIPVDESRGDLLQAAENHYNGDLSRLIDDYYRTVAGVLRATGCDIIGHFDLITKFNEDGTLFDTDAPTYKASWSRALDQLFEDSARLRGAPPVFEINTGAISRGYRREPYPAADILRGIKERGGKIILTADAHSKEAVDDHFDLSRSIAKEAGFTETTVLTESGFCPAAL